MVRPCRSGLFHVYMISMTSVPIDTSCVAIKHQSTIARFGDSWDKIGIGITPDPFGRGAYNLQSISATRRKWSGSRDYSQVVDESCSSQHAMNRARCVLI